MSWMSVLTGCQLRWLQAKRGSPVPAIFDSPCASARGRRQKTGITERWLCAEARHCGPCSEKARALLKGQRVPPFCIGLVEAKPGAESGRKALCQLQGARCRRIRLSPKDHIAREAPTETSHPKKGNALTRCLPVHARKGLPTRDPIHR